MKTYKTINTIKISRMIEIEEMISLGQNASLINEEREYLEFAIRMPFSEMKTFIEFYDSSHPKLDEIKFISILKTRYKESQENVIKRIRQVRRIMEYEKKLEESNSFSKILNK